MIFRFGNFVVDTERLELRRNGALCDVEPQVFSLIVYLIAERDRVVGKDELIDAVWGGQIISDSALNARISAARRAVDDNGKDQAVIRTFSRRGFRFVADVAEAAADAASGAAAGQDGPASRPDLGTSGHRPDRSAKPVVAVLPFDNLSADESQKFYADAITEDIITALTKNRWLLVVARNSTFAFREHSTDMRRVARDLGADYLVEGSVRKAANRVRITAQLIDGASGSHIWAQNYDCDVENLFDVQDEITGTIVGRIEPELGQYERSRATSKPPQNLDAWDHYHLGLAHFYKFNEADNLAAQDQFRRCIAFDPNFGPAHSWLAYAIIIRSVYFEAELDPESFEEANAAIQRAIEIDNQDALAHFAAGRVHLAGRDYGAAVREMELAIDLNPCLAVAYCGLGDALAYVGRMEDSIPQFERAIHLSPHDPFRWAFFAYRSLAHLFLRQFEEAAEWADRASRIPNSHYMANAHLVAALGHLDRPDEAEAALARLLRRKPGFSRSEARKRLFYIKDPDQLALYDEGLRKAGLAED